MEKNNTMQEADKLVVNRTTRKDHNENQITNNNYDKNSMSIFKNNQNKIKLASD